ncbi:MAG: hypothetical protein NTZ73_00310 [Candidatus Diapherotrites archaeon]|nr:hypothetical protein [Candidatus Diapherotrites archaeon]
MKLENFAELMEAVTVRKIEIYQYLGETYSIPKDILRERIGKLDTLLFLSDEEKKQQKIFLKTRRQQILKDNPLIEKTVRQRIKGFQ